MGRGVPLLIRNRLSVTSSSSMAIRDGYRQPQPLELARLDDRAALADVDDLPFLDPGQPDKPRCLASRPRPQGRNVPALAEQAGVRVRVVEVRGLGPGDVLRRPHLDAVGGELSREPAQVRGDASGGGDRTAGVPDRVIRGHAVRELCQYFRSDQ
jgi:hypothetical protein